MARTLREKFGFGVVYRENSDGGGEYRNYLIVRALWGAGLIGMRHRHTQLID